MPRAPRRPGRPSLIRSLLVALAIAPLAISGQTQPALADPGQPRATVTASQETGTLSGQLRRQESPGHPIDIGGYTISVSGYSTATPYSYTATPDASGRFTLSGIAPGSYLITVHAPGDQFHMKFADGAFWADRSFNSSFETFVSAGDSLRGDFFVPYSLNPLTIERERLAGADRYQTAAAVSRYAFLDPTPVAFIASGQDFPDALSAAPAAAHLNAPLLLTARDRIPDAIVTELRRLKTTKAIVVGGTGSIGAAVVTKLQSMGISVVRLAGADRYSTSIKVAKYAFPQCVTLSIAAGTDFPDALAISTMSGPLLLVPGSASTLRSDIRTTVETFDCGSARIAGGTGAVSSGIERQLRAMVPEGVVRYAGTDRYDTARRIADTGGVQRPHVFIASGSDFPDALAIAPYAGRVGGPLYLARPTCVPGASVDQIRRGSPAVVTVVGGTGVLDWGVPHLTRC